MIESKHPYNLEQPVNVVFYNLSVAEKTRMLSYSSVTNESLAENGNESVASVTSIRKDLATRRTSAVCGPYFSSLNKRQSRLASSWDFIVVI
jgi:hypothetical protein